MTGSRREPLRVLLVGPVPPPYSGKNIAIETLLAGSYEDVELLHVNASYAESLADMGRVSLRKVARLVAVLAQALWVRGTRRPGVLFYNPAGSDRPGILRDIPVLLILRPLFRRVVLHLHARGLPEGVQSLPRPLRRLAQRAYGRPDVLLAPSKVTLDEAASLRPVRTRVIPNGTRGGQPPAAPTSAGSATTVLFLNLISEEKGAGWLLESVAALQHAGLDVRLRLAGELASDVYGAQLEARARALGIEDKVEMLGLVTGEQKWEAIASADVFCVPSTWPQETFGLVLIEAASCARPVVAADVPGVREVLQPGVSILLADPSDRATLTAHLERLCRDAALREEMGTAARAAYEERYTLEHHWAAVGEVFADLRAEEVVTGA